MEDAYTAILPFTVFLIKKRLCMNKYEIEPVGYIISDYKKRALTHEESVNTPRGNAVIKINSEFKKGLLGLKKGDKISVIFYFHMSRDYKLTVLKNPSDSPLGIFAVRSPDRPNGIGISKVEILEVKDDTLKINNSDMIDGTPIIDIKPGW